MRACNLPDWSTARSELSDLLVSAGWRPSVISDAELALHEVFVNAWRHGGTLAPVVVLALTGHRLRVSVADNNPIFPTVHLPTDPLASSGRGLFLVRALTHRLGAEPRKTGKVVWFELEASA
ncbi:ATP-binding protein [Kitasatospora sp. MY 5-36]|uniref:ATP-binding protein n=1 Tax=Kitasatospora sp. MY 5-36 TaxID=1678027 RepID=UPI0006707CB4|nr:ATP-binding protein [Kitasatospora sp. MY 5-36]